MTKVVGGVRILGIFQQSGQQNVRIEEIDSHRSRDHLRIDGGSLFSPRRLLLETSNSSITGNFHHSKPPCFAGIDVNGCKRNISSGSIVLFQHEPVVHLVNMIAGENQYMLGLLTAYG